MNFYECHIGNSNYERALDTEEFRNKKTKVTLAGASFNVVFSYEVFKVLS